MFRATKSVLLLNFAVGCATCMSGGWSGVAQSQTHPEQVNLGFGAADRIGTKEEPFGYSYGPGVWPRRVGQSVTIRVCWEDVDAAYISERRQVASAVASTWSQAAAVEFEGWEKCSNSDTQSVRIAVADVGPHAKKLGQKIAGVRDGVVLNFELKRWIPKAWCLESASRKRQCILAIAVHEFGHVLSLAHEHNRSDTPQDCEEMPQGPDGTDRIGVYDKDSIMNYCHEIYARDGMKLSKGDIAAVQTLYGVRY